MTEEEKEAVKYTENCLMKITMGIDCEFDVNILDALINIIKKLQKENEELKNQEATARRINELLVQRYSNSIPIQKVKEKIRKNEEIIDISNDGDLIHELLQKIKFMKNYWKVRNKNEV